MRKPFCLGIVLALVFAVTSLHAETADEFLKAYFFVQDGDSAEKGGEKSKAVEKYSEALKILRQIARTAPDWNPNIITYRTKYCAEHIVKDGGQIPSEEAAPAPEPVDSTPPIDTVPHGVAPAPSTPELVPMPSDSASSSGAITAPPPDASASDRVTYLERELQRARDELRKVQDEKGDLESRLKRAEEDLKVAQSGGDERVHALLRENSFLKEQLSDAEAKLRNLPTGAEDIAALKADLAKAQAGLKVAKRESDDLRRANESLKRSLEETRMQLKTATSMAASDVSSEALQTLQKENALLRAIVDRQFQEDARRMAARDSLARELRELSSRTEAIRAQLEILQTPLAPLSEEERQLLKTPGAGLRAGDDDSRKLTGVVTAGRGAGSGSSSRLSGDNTLLADDAKRLFSKGDMQGAAAKYKQILQSEPNNLFALSNLGVIRFRQDKIDEAEKALQAALAIDPQDAFSLSVLGIVHYRQDKFDEAIGDLTRAIAINPNNYETHNYLGITYSQKGYQEAAEKELLKAIELQPNYGDAHFNLAVVFASQTPPSIELARRHYKKALELGMEKDPELEKLLKK